MIWYIIFLFSQRNKLNYVQLNFWFNLSGLTSAAKVIWSWYGWMARDCPRFSFFCWRRKNRLLARSKCKVWFGLVLEARVSIFMVLHFTCQNSLPISFCPNISEHFFWKFLKTNCQYVPWMQKTNCDPRMVVTYLKILPRPQIHLGQSLWPSFSSPQILVWV